MSDRKPTAAELEAYRQFQARQDAATSQYLDARDLEEIRRNSPEMKAQRAAIERASKQRHEAMHAAREKDRIEAEQRAAEREAELEKALEPTKEAEYRKWQIEHPESSRAKFDTKIWPLLKEQLTSRDALIERETERLRSSAIYNI